MAQAESVLAVGKSSERTAIDASLVQILSSVGAVVMAVILVVTGLRNVDIDALPLIAGLGVGGLAIALAIRPTLENLIGGLILHSDKPLRLGDFCNIGGVEDTIEAIGIRSTKICVLDRALISIPNARHSDTDIINFAHYDRMLVNATLNLRRRSPPSCAIGWPAFAVCFMRTPR